MSPFGGVSSLETAFAAAALPASAAAWTTSEAENLSNVREGKGLIVCDYLVKFSSGYAHSCAPLAAGELRNFARGVKTTAVNL